MLVRREPHGATYDLEDEVVVGGLWALWGPRRGICLVNSLAPSVSAPKGKQWVKAMEGGNTFGCRVENRGWDLGGVIGSE